MGKILWKQPKSTPVPCGMCGGSGQSRLAPKTCQRCGGSGVDPYASR
jgi:DnaJ-class molecular chaperone